MNTNYSLLFYLKKPKNYVNVPKPIYMRITVAAVPRELSAGRECDPARWNPMSNRAKGQKEEIRNLNTHLDTLERKIEDVHSSLVKLGAEITSQLTKLEYLGKDVIRHYLMEVFDEHNSKMQTLLGKRYQHNTLKGYRTSVSHLTEYLQ